jgi:hypothetical protein
MTGKSKAGKSKAGKSKASKPMTRKAKIARRTRTVARRSRAKKPDAMETLLAAGAQALALPIDPAWRAEVKLNLQLIFRYAALVEEFALPDETEPAPVFRA